MTSTARFTNERFSPGSHFLAVLIALSMTTFACADAHNEGGEGNEGGEASIKSEATKASSGSQAITRSVEDVSSIEPNELAARLQSKADAPLVLDVRTKAEFDAGHIPGAVHIPHDELASRLSEIDAAVEANREIAVHCMVGPRARMAEATLAAAGIEHILHLEGGYRAWSKAGLETAN